MRRRDHCVWWLGLLIFLASGCATGRDIVDVRVQPGGGAPTGPLVHIERAIARKRGGFGKALGDILLPEGRTVMKPSKRH